MYKLIEIKRLFQNIAKTMLKYRLLAMLILYIHHDVSGEIKFIASSGTLGHVEC